MVTNVDSCRVSLTYLTVNSSNTHNLHLNISFQVILILVTWLLVPQGVSYKLSTSTRQRLRKRNSYLVGRLIIRYRDWTCLQESWIASPIWSGRQACQLGVMVSVHGLPHISSPVVSTILGGLVPVLVKVLASKWWTNYKARQVVFDKWVYQDADIIRDWPTTGPATCPPVSPWFAVHIYQRRKA